MNQKCPYCHQLVSQFEWSAHIQQHTQRLPDGQMRDHVTKPAEQRYQGSIAGQPQWYVHPQCGGVTGMPEEIIRSYLADPFLYNDRSFCTGCGKYVSTDELFWHGTNQSLTEHTKQLRIDYIARNHLNPQDFDWGPRGPTRKNAGLGVAGTALVGVAILGVLMCAGCAGLFVWIGSIQPDRVRPNRPIQKFEPPFAQMPPLEPIEIPQVPVGGIPEPFIPETAFEPPSFQPPPLPGGPPRGYDPNEFLRQVEERQKQQEAAFRARREESRRDFEQRARERQEQMQRRMDDLRNRSPFDSLP